MKKLIALFILLVGIFLGTWTYKIQTPVTRPDEYLNGYDTSAGAWWLTGRIQSDDNWMLDPTIESNYVPVPGEENLFMVIDENGNIIKYRKRTKQPDGSWTWEDVNPDIPDDYEPVEGLENVFKVTAADGSVKYLKYIRNSDGTYAFVEVDENGNPLNHNDDATTIDNKHVHIVGNYYKLLDDNGVTIGYEKRVDNGDGTFSWVTSLLDMSQLLDGSGTLNMGGADTGGSSINPNNGFLDEYQQRMEAANSNAGVASDTINITLPRTDTYYTIPVAVPGNGIVDVTPDTVKTISNPDGTHTDVYVQMETMTVGGYTTTYQTTVMKTYDAAGNLISSQSEGPFEVSREPSLIQNDAPVQADTASKLPTLPAEYARVCGSYTYDDNIAAEVIADLNAERAANGKNTLAQSQEATYVAKLRAADMAAYNVSTGNLPTYGSLGSMLSEYQVDSMAAGENMWKTPQGSTEDIVIRFKTAPEAYETMIKGDVSQVGVAVCIKGGVYYICEVLV